MSKLTVVGIGPGGLNHMTFEARSAIECADVIVGYKTYLDLIEPLLANKEVVSSGMMREVERCREAIAIAATGKTVALVSSGDAGVYGMAGLALELGDETAADVEIVIVPGVSAVQAAASVLGAPLMHDFAVISLSDLMTPWETIRLRLEAAAGADFVVALYNPRSKGRVTQIEEAAAIFIAARGTDVPVGIVRNACRDGEERIITTLGEMLQQSIDMFSIVIVGNSATRLLRDGRILTPRGYTTDGSHRNRSRKEDAHAAGESANSVGAPFVARIAEADRGRNAAPTGGILPANDIPRSQTPDPRPPARALMFCGTGSDVGKSVLAAGFCRVLKRRGISVAPFKSQNMALNSAVTPEGGEIGRAQAVQAEACGIEPHTDMNPVLLKPNSDLGSQVIVQGRVVGNMAVKQYHEYKPLAFEKVRESFQRLKGRYSFIVMEGAGSIAEVNLKAHDIANLKAAEMAGAPAILVADIDRGGVFAQIVGTIELLDPEERARVKGVLINKFRGDASLLKSGIELVEQRTGIPVLGVLPWFTGFAVPEEDSVALRKRATRPTDASGAGLKIGVIRLGRISNYTDFEALEREPDVEFSYLEAPDGIDLLDLVIIPGTKSTIADLNFMRDAGFFEALRRYRGMIAGICGGYQILGKSVADPEGVESEVEMAEGVGLLDVRTTLLGGKKTHRAAGSLAPAGLIVAPGAAPELAGYEIHMGESIVGDAEPFATLTERSGNPIVLSDGAVSEDGRIFGTYLHGIFDNPSFRTALLNRLRKERGLPEREVFLPEADPLDLLADHLERHLDLERIFTICGEPVAGCAG